MWDWTIQEWIIFSIPFALIALGVLIWLGLRRTVRTRLRLAKQLQDDPDIDEFLIVFNWSRKALYIPTICASIIAAVVSGFIPDNAEYFHVHQIIGGVWLAVFFVNFLIDEYEVSIKILFIALLIVAVIALWLVLLGLQRYVGSFFAGLGIRIDWKGYVLLAGIFLLAVIVAWVRGLFYYVAFTPNYMNIQTGPTETGEQVDHKDYSTRIDTGDFLERLLGFGRIIVTFRDHTRLPMSLLVGRVGTAARKLESIRGKIAVDRGEIPKAAPPPEGL
jgi:hypothetical protein